MKQYLVTDSILEDYGHDRYDGEPHEAARKYHNIHELQPGAKVLTREQVERLLKPHSYASEFREDRYVYMDDILDELFGEGGWVNE